MPQKNEKIKSVKQAKQSNKKNTPEERTYIVAGYVFKSKKSAELAENELNAINYMLSRVNQEDPAQVYLLYNKILDRELFKTAIGFDYLKELQDYLYAHEAIPDDKIRPIPVDEEIEEVLKGSRRTTDSKNQQIRELERQVEKYKTRKVKSIIINFILVAVIIATFYILQSGSQTTVINYENKLLNKYASWEEELRSREATLKEKERNFEKQSKSAAEKGTEKSTEKQTEAVTGAQNK